VIHVPSRRGRIVVARLERGEDLHAALLELARWESIDAGIVRGTGLLEEVVLHAYAGKLREESLVARGELELVALSGSIALRDGAPEVRLHAVVGHPAGGAEGTGLPSGVAAAGFVASARALAVELVVDVLDDVYLDLRVDDETGLPIWYPSPRR